MRDILVQTPRDRLLQIASNMPEHMVKDAIEGLRILMQTHQPPGKPPPPSAKQRV